MGFPIFLLNFYAWRQLCIKYFSNFEPVSSILKTPFSVVLPFPCSARLVSYWLEYFLHFQFNWIDSCFRGFPSNRAVCCRVDSCILFNSLDLIKWFSIWRGYEETESKYNMELFLSFYLNFDKGSIKVWLYYWFISPFLPSSTKIGNISYISFLFTFFGSSHGMAALRLKCNIKLNAKKGHA